MRKFLGSYGIGETLVSLGFFSLLAYFDYMFFSGVFAGENITEQLSFVVVFINLVLLVIIALPYISKKAEAISNDKFKEFIDLPEKNSKFTFSTISGFLGDQALASFLATVLIFTGKQALENYGGGLAAAYTIFLFIVAIVLGTVSLVRFIFHFTKLHWFYYALCSLLSTGIMFAFFHVGLKMAA